MRGIKSFFMSGAVLCVLYLVMQTTFFSNVFFNHGAQTPDITTQAWYSRFNLPMSADAEQAEAPAEEPAAPAAETPAPAAEEPAPAAEAPAVETPAPAAEEKKEETPAAAPAAEEPKKEEAPAAAAKPAEGEKKEEKPEEPEIVGIDTVDLKEPSGNWILKRSWWEKAQKHYAEIKGINDQIYAERMPFHSRRAKIDRDTLEPLYVHAGLDRADFVEILTKLNTLLDVEQEKHTPLDEKDMAMREKALAQKKSLDDLQKDVAKLSEYETALDKFLDKLMEQVNVAHNYEKQAWQAYVNIGEELNDKRAHDLYWEMDAQLEGVKGVLGYIRGPFKQGFDQLDKTVTEQAKRITDALTSLKEGGLDLKEYSAKLGEKIQQEATHEETVQEETPEEGGIMGTLASWWNMVKDLFVSAYDWIMSFFSGSSDAAETTESTSSSDTTESTADKAQEAESAS